MWREREDVIFISLINTNSIFKNDPCGTFVIEVYLYVEGFNQFYKESLEPAWNCSMFDENV